MSEIHHLFFGYIHKCHIKYIRNHTFKTLNTLKSDPYMPYIESKKENILTFGFLRLMELMLIYLIKPYRNVT